MLIYVCVDFLFIVTLLICIAVRELTALHNKRLMVNFSADESSQEREIEDKTQEITDLFRHAEVLLKKFARQGDESQASQQELAVRNNLQRSMAKKLQGLSMQFRTSQKVVIVSLFIIAKLLCPS